MLDCLAGEISADCVAAAEVVPGSPDLLRVVAVSGSGAKDGDLISNSPATFFEETLVSCEVCVVKNDARGLFPADRFLEETQAEACLGVRLTTVAGEVIGGVAALYHRPISEPGRLKSALERHASRVSAALELQQRSGWTDKIEPGPQRRLRELLESIDIAGITLDVNGTVTFCNRCLLDLTGWQRSDVLYHDWFTKFVLEGEREQARVHFFSSAADGIAPLPLESPIVTRNGEARVIRWSSSVLRDDAGNAAEVAMLGLDVTEQRLLAGSVAHEFNNLLTVIEGYCESALRMSRAVDPLYAQVKEIKKASSRAGELSRRLLASARPAQLRIVNPNDVVQDSMNMVRQVAGDQIEILTQVTPAAGSIKADAGQLQQVILNLVLNARDAMPQGGKLLIKTENVRLEGQRAEDGIPSGDYVLLVVSDTGIGMDEETRAHLFQPFFKTKELGKGTGIGLSIVFGIVKQSNGHIRVSSKPSEGSTFEIYFPWADLKTPTEANHAPAMRDGLSGSETILIAEDQPEIRMLARKALQSCGYFTLEAANGEEALRICADHRGPIDLLLTDIIMPGMNGLDLAENVRQIRPDIKIIRTSGYADPLDSGAGVVAGGQAYLRKPFSPHTLASKVRATLDFGRRSKRTIAVVDEKASVRGLLCEILAGAGYEVVEAANWTDAVGRLKEKEVDLMLIDLAVAGQEGLDIISELRRTMPGLKIIAMSGKLEGTPLQVARRAGADATLRKPIGTSALIRSVREILSAE